VNVWRDRLNRWLTPLARGFPLSPNAITVLALMLVLCAAAALAFARQHPVLFLIAVPILGVGGLLDAFDGVVARVQGKQSTFGDFLDHFFDRIADLTLLSCWCIGAGVGIEISLLALLSVSLNGYLGTQIEASFGERSYEGTGRGEFVIALVILPLAAYSLARAGLLSRPFGGLSVPEWATTVLAFFALLGVIQRFRRALRYGA
jgi:archaetidylinositol phosphate synthase